MWIEVLIDTVSEGAELVSELLLELGSSGTQIIDRNDIPDADKPLHDWELIDAGLKESLPKNAQVKGWFENELPSNIEEALKKLKNNSEIALGSLDIRFKSNINEDWGEKWRSFYKPFHIGERILIKPSWEEVEAKKDELIIELDPGMAFGTGTHETSSLVLALMEKQNLEGKSVLDIGTGSGILAILAAKLRAGRVLGIDIDETAVRVAKENVQKNGVDCEIRLGDLTKGIDERFDLVLANILAEIIVLLLPSLKFVLNEGARAILSGILKEKEGIIEPALEKEGYKILEKSQKGEWLAYVIEKNV